MNDMLTLDQIKAALGEAVSGPWGTHPICDGESRIYKMKRPFPIGSKIPMVLAEFVSTGSAPLMAMAPDLAQLALDQAAEIDRLLRVMKAISSCGSFMDEDVVSLAREALKGGD